MSVQTLDQAKEWLRSQVKAGGARCPCCDQWAKISKRKLNSSMVRQFLWLAEMYRREGRWIHCNDEGPKTVFKNFQLGTVAHWGLIEQKPNDLPAKKTSGLWRPTGKGLLFAERKVKVPTHVWIYDRKALRFTDELTDIAGAYGRHFHYAELMRELFP